MFNQKKMVSFFMAFIVLFSCLIFVKISNDSSLIAKADVRSSDGIVPLFTPVNELEDGAVYFIRNAYNTSLVWDMPNANMNEGVNPILYSQLGWGNQRFIVNKQTSYEGVEYYTISPLYASDKTLRVNTSNENELVVLGVDTNTSEENFLSNKFGISNVEGSSNFVITTGRTDFEKTIIPNGSNASTNNTLAQKNIANANSELIYQWQFLKTDTLGLSVKNKVLINGSNISYFNLTPPSLGTYIIETQNVNPNDSIDTYIELYDSNGGLLAFSDDHGDGLNARVVYNFTTLNDCTIRLFGYDDDVYGYTNLVLRPNKELYFSAVYDPKNNNNDRATPLKQAQEQLIDYHLTVQTNLGKSAILEYNTIGKRKINCDYYVFSGHGYVDAAAVQFYNALNKEAFYWHEIPDLQGTTIAIWMACHSARNYYKYSNSNELVSMAHQSVVQGADYSLGYVGAIYDVTQNMFPVKFFEALKTYPNYTIDQAVQQAIQWTINNNWWWWQFFGQYNDDFDNPILYQKGDSLNLNCGNGVYEDDKKFVEPIEKNLLLNESGLIKNGYICNLDKDEINGISFRDDAFEKLIDYKFITKYNGEILKLGFECEKSTNRVYYYDITNKKQIDSTEFELKMGKINKELYSIL